MPTLHSGCALSAAFSARVPSAHAAGAATIRRAEFAAPSRRPRLGYSALKRCRTI